MRNIPISVITVVLNDISNIEATINSVLSQNYPNVEYIIIDGGSTDGTLEILRKYENQISRLVSEPDKNLYDAMNKGTCLANGEWISYMNSGDKFYDSNVLTRIFIENKNEVANYDVIYSDAIADFKTRQLLHKAKNINLFWRGLPFSHQAHFVKIYLAKKRLFNLRYTVSADYDFLYAIYKSKAKFYYFKSPIAIVDVTTGISKNIKLSIVYKDFLEISKINSSIIQHTSNYLISPIQYLYSIIRRFFK